MNPVDFDVTFPDGKPINEAKLLGDTTENVRASLMRLGAFIRRRAQTSIRYQKKRSEPGQPPRGLRSGRFQRTTTDKITGLSKSRATSPLRELIAFAVVETGDGSFKLLVGPMLFRQTRIGTGGIIPRLLEIGGTGIFVSGRKKLTGRFDARPFMGPAFRAELPQVPKLFKGLVSGKAR